MATEKYITAIGVSEEDVAHIRLLMRKSASELSNVWRWGAHAQADLLLVDVSNFAGQMARSRAKVTGMRVVLICDPGDATDGDPAFFRPFKSENVFSILNGATGDSSALRSSIQRGDDYYQSQMREFESDSDLSDLLMPEQASPRVSADADVAPGLDEFIRTNLQKDPNSQFEQAPFDENAEVESSGDQTRRGALRSDRQREANAVPLNAATAARKPLHKQKLEDLSAHSLRAFLEGNLLAGPVQIAWPDAGELTLDPKNQVFHNAQKFSTLEPYCRTPLRRNDWRVLTSTELNTIRQTQEAQPYAKLIWLDVLLHANGQLASNLDPGGTFELSRWLEMARDYPNYARISSALMKPARLHEVAATSGCEMSMVFDVVSAYDAIGWLKWTPRRSRHESEEKPKGSLLSRLRNRLGKS